MGYVVYIDIIFIFNVCMDVLLLRMFGKMTGKKQKWPRILLAAVIGGLSGVLKAYQKPSPNVVFAFLMMRTAFGKMKIKEICKNVVLFYAFHMMIGGCLFFLKEQNLIKNHALPVLIVVFLVSAAVLKGVEHLMRRAGFMKHLYDIECYEGGSVIYGKALLDTGNRLYDPYFHRPVMIGEYEAVKPIYDGYDKEKLLLIPFHSLGKENGMIPALKVEKLWIYTGEEKILNENVLIAVKRGSLSSENKYQFILHEDFLQKKL